MTCRRSLTVGAEASSRRTETRRPQSLPALSMTTVTLVSTHTHTGAVHTKTLFCENAHVLHRFGRPSIRILKMQRLKTHFFENSSQGEEIRKRNPPIFMWTAKPHTFQNNDGITLPSTSEPRDVSQQQQQWRWTTCLCSYCSRY